MKLSWPILGIGKVPGIFISQWFGENEWLYGKGGHNGIDIAAPEGTPILACASAPITKATDRYVVGGRNYGIMVQQEWQEEGHAWKLIYGHMSSQPWGELPDNTMKACQLETEIGKVGHTGFVVSQGGLGNHLHLSLYRDGVAVDPLPYMKILIRQVGWTDQEKGFYIPADTMDRLNQIIDSIPALKDDFQFDPAEWNLARRPWPPLHP